MIMNMCSEVVFMGCVFSIINLYGVSFPNSNSANLEGPTYKSVYFEKGKYLYYGGIYT